MIGHRSSCLSFILPAAKDFWKFFAAVAGGRVEKERLPLMLLNIANVKSGLSEMQGDCSGRSNTIIVRQSF